MPVHQENKYTELAPENDQLHATRQATTRKKLQEPEKITGIGPGLNFRRCRSSLCDA